MRIVIAGATGFLGQPLIETLIEDGHAVTVLTRSGNQRPDRVPMLQWMPDGSVGSWAKSIDGADAIVNLAGEPIAARRWTDAQKRRILDSRVLATRSIVSAISAASHRPSVWINASAVGYYGPCGSEIITEDHPAGGDFLAHVCESAEVEALRAASDLTRVVNVRTGLVLERDGGALRKMLPPFWFGAGGAIGSGRQYWPWIHRSDWIGLMRFALGTSAVTGALNATAPRPVTNADFARALGRAIGRPAIVPTPGFALKLILGEMAEGLLLSGQRAVPAKAEQLGFEFEFPEVDRALTALFP